MQVAQQTFLLIQSYFESWIIFFSFLFAFMCVSPVGPTVGVSTRHPELHSDQEEFGKAEAASRRSRAVGADQIWWWGFNNKGMCMWSVQSSDNFRMAQTTEWLQAIHNYTKKVMSSISTVFGPFSSLQQLIYSLINIRSCPWQARRKQF